MRWQRKSGCRPSASRSRRRPSASGSNNARRRQGRRAAGGARNRKGDDRGQCARRWRARRIAAETGAMVSIGALLGSLGAASVKPRTRRRRRRSPWTPRPRRCRRRPPRPRSPPRTALTFPPLRAPASAVRCSRATCSRRSIGRRGRRPRLLLRLCLHKRAPRAGPVSAPAAVVPLPTPAPAAPDDTAREERVRLTKLRQTIARRLKDAQNTAAMLTTFNEVDMSEVMSMRARYKERSRRSTVASSASWASSSRPACRR